MPKQSFNQLQQQERVKKNLSPPRINSNTQQHQQLKIIQKSHMELFKRLTREEYELVKFYQLQAGSYIEELCRLIEDFFNVVEEQHMQAAKIFVQKIQIVTILILCKAEMG